MPQTANGLEPQQHQTLGPQVLEGRNFLVAHHNLSRQKAVLTRVVGMYVAAAPATVMMLLTVDMPHFVHHFPTTHICWDDTPCTPLRAPARTLGNLSAPCFASASKLLYVTAVSIAPVSASMYARVLDTCGYRQAHKHSTAHTRFGHASDCRQHCDCVCILCSNESWLPEHS